MHRKVVPADHTNSAFYVEFIKSLGGGESNITTKHHATPASQWSTKIGLKFFICIQRRNSIKRDSEGWSHSHIKSGLPQVLLANGMSIRASTMIQKVTTRHIYQNKYQHCITHLCYYSYSWCPLLIADSCQHAWHDPAGLESAYLHAQKSRTWAGM